MQKKCGKISTTKTGTAKTSFTGYSSSMYKTWDFLGVWYKKSETVGLPFLWWAQTWDSNGAQSWSLTGGAGAYTRWDLTDVVSPDKTAITQHNDTAFKNTYITIKVVRADTLLANSSTNGTKKDSYTIAKDDGSLSMSTYLYMPTATGKSNYIYIEVISAQKVKYGFVLEINSKAVNPKDETDPEEDESKKEPVPITELYVYQNGTVDINSTKYGPGTNGVYVRGTDVDIDMAIDYVSYWFEVVAPKLGYYSVTMYDPGRTKYSNKQQCTHNDEDYVSNRYKFLVTTTNQKFKTFYGYTVEIRYVGNTARAGTDTVEYYTATAGTGTTETKIDPLPLRKYAFRSLDRDGTVVFEVE